VFNIVVSSHLSNYAQVREPVCTWAERAAEKLHKENQYCRQIGGHLRTTRISDFPVVK